MQVYSNEAKSITLSTNIAWSLNAKMHSDSSYVEVMLGLHRNATNLGPIYELKNSGFLGLVSSRYTFIARSQARIYIDVEERLTYE